MTERIEWQVSLSVYGPIESRNSHFNVLKGWNITDPFYGEIRLGNIRDGVRASITAFAPTGELARKAALLFFGQMLDTLTIDINLPLYLSLHERPPSHIKEHATLRIVEESEWKAAFREARLLAFSEPVFLRALSWYRKGLFSEDPYDRFLAFWNSIEVVTSKYHPPIPENREDKSKSQMWESFKALWGECAEWPVSDTWIDDNYQTRKDIAQGTIPVNVEDVSRVLAKMDVIERLAYRFLNEWRIKQLKPNIPLELEPLFSDTD
jgi:hypothetical protein